MITYFVFALSAALALAVVLAVLAGVDAGSTGVVTVEGATGVVRVADVLGVAFGKPVLGSMSTVFLRGGDMMAVVVVNPPAERVCLTPLLGESNSVAWRF